MTQAAIAVSIVAGCVIYVIWRWSRVWCGKAGGCGGCGKCVAAKAEIEASQSQSTSALDDRGLTGR